MIKLVTLISFKSEGIPAIPNSEAKETKTNTAATLAATEDKECPKPEYNVPIKSVRIR